MKVGINLLSYKEITGWVIYAQNLLESLAYLDENDKFFLFVPEDLFDWKLNNLQNVNLVCVSGLRRRFAKGFYQQTLMYLLLKKYKIDLLFSPSPAAPFFYKNKIVVIHDCAYDRFPEFENILSKMYFKLMFYGAKYFSKKIVTVSNFSKKELIDLYKIKPEKIEVIYEGVPEMPEFKEELAEETLKRFQINKPYFFYIGNWRPRKNLPGLIKAFKVFSEKHKDFLLVIVGRKDKRFLNLEREVEKNQLGEKVVLIDFVSSEEKVALYKKAIALTFPSYYEGFGLPVLEAQSLGVPVLTSNTSALPEVGGKGALYVNPYNIEEIAQGMEKVVFDKNLREDIIKNGYENIKRFSWDRSAKKLLEVFHEACD